MPSQLVAEREQFARPEELEWRLSWDGFSSWMLWPNLESRAPGWSDACVWLPSAVH